MANKELPVQHGCQFVMLAWHTIKDFVTEINLQILKMESM